MKFDDVLHPEIALDKRGNPELRRIYRSFLDGVSYCADGWTYTKSDGEVKEDEGRSVFLQTNSDYVKRGKVEGGTYTKSRFLVKAMLRQLDENSRDHFCLVKKFKSENGRLYHVNRDFLQTLSQIDKEIPIDCLPDSFLGYISFAPKTISDDTGFIQGAYVFIGDGEETPLGPELWGKKVLWCSYIEEGDKLTVTALRVDLQNKTMQDLLSELKCYDYGWKKNEKTGFVTPSKTENTLLNREAVFRTIVNSVIYIFCQNPILEKAPGLVGMSQTQQKKYRQSTGLLNATSLPITFVNWKYERPIAYSKDKTSVIGHFRRQHYGPRNILVKAIFIEEHIRTLNKDLPAYQYEPKNTDVSRNLH